MRGWLTLAAVLLPVGGSVLSAPAGSKPAPKKPAQAGKSAAPATPPAVAARNALDAGLQKGVAYLRRSQKADGSWQNYPGITSVCLLALLRAGVPKSDPAVIRAANYLAGLARPDGSITSDAFGPAQALPNYNTALAITALHSAGRPAHAEIVRRGQQFLVASQYDEGEGFTPKERQYGGIGYGSRQDNPDVSNLQNALEALRDTGYPKNTDVFNKALLFLERCQNRRESNDQPWAGLDGGFVYASSGESKADEYTRRPHSSYGSMTYAGLKSYLYCSLDRDDERVQAAWTWIRDTFDVRQNPRMGADGLYYYYHTMAKTLDVWNERVVIDRAGKRHAWAQELSREILRRQQKDGSWVNENKRWWEDRPDLVTGYALLALAHCRKGL